MNKEKYIKNFYGLLSLKEIKLEYSKTIVLALKENPEIYPYVLEKLEVNEDEFFKRILGEANITYYDAVLLLIREATEAKTINEENGSLSNSGGK